MEGASTEPTPAETLRSQSEKVEYVVQERTTLPDAESGGEMWLDIATVSVPKRSQTRTVLLQALSDAGISVQEAVERERQFRVLDEEHSHAHRLKVKEPREPEIELA